MHVCFGYRVVDGVVDQHRRDRVIVTIGCIYETRLGICDSITRSDHRVRDGADNVPSVGGNRIPKDIEAQIRKDQKLRLVTGKRTYRLIVVGSIRRRHPDGWGVNIPGLGQVDHEELGRSNTGRYCAALNEQGLVFNKSGGHAAGGHIDGSRYRVGLRPGMDGRDSKKDEGTNCVADR